MRHAFWIPGLLGLCLSSGAMLGGPVLAHATDRETKGPALRVVSFQPDRPLCRARRPASLVAVLANDSEAAAAGRARLSLPPGVRTTSRPECSVAVPEGDEVELVWPIVADRAGEVEVRLHLDAGGRSTETPLMIRVLPAVEITHPSYIPTPKPVRTKMLVGVHNCPLWEADRPQVWAQLSRHPERTPALGLYDQANPEVADWETKWAVEHGINFFIYCWYRDGQGGPVKTAHSSAIHPALFRSKFVDQMKFTIMWENQAKGRAGVADEADLLKNLLPFWIDNYFKHPSYLRVDNKPVLFIYRPEFLPDDLGGESKVPVAFDKMRRACRDAGFAGLHILGEFRGANRPRLELLKRLGLDCVFSYCIPLSDSPSPDAAVRREMEFIRTVGGAGILPTLVTVTQGWSGWHDEGSIWKLPPGHFETVLRQARDYVTTRPATDLSTRMILLDNWNEWGEGHYIAPHREYGFGYLDAIRNVFAVSPEDPDEPHADLIPEDVGRGPYDRVMTDRLRRDRELGRLARRRPAVTAAPAPGLLGHWTFDDDADSPVALDYSGHRLGAILRDARRDPGRGGLPDRALVCDGRSAVVPTTASLFPKTTLTVECWVRTTQPAQNNTWFIGAAAGGGYRMGMVSGKPAFGMPVTRWSHHLAAKELLPLNRWVHLAGTFDGKTMRLYMDGVESGAMDRPAGIKPTDLPVCLGNHAENHPAHFAGLLDDVRIYGRALTAEELAQHAKEPARRPIEP